MLPFFRKIRYRLAQDNKFLQYSRYAIGEIVLVVVGILIALQINNWNQWRQEREVEQTVLEQLKEDYLSNLAQLEQKIEIRNALIDAALSILESTDNPEQVIRDSLIADLTVLLIDPTFDPIENDLSSAGDLRLITNKELKHLLSTWTADIIAVREIEQDWSTIVYEQLQSVFSDLGISRDLANHFTNDLDLEWQLEKGANLKKMPIGRARQGASVEEIAQSKELEGLVSFAITYNSAANLESETLRKHIKRIIQLIEGEIEK
jgi:hypothetical protein